MKRESLTIYIDEEMQDKITTLWVHDQYNKGKGHYESRQEFLRRIISEGVNAIFKGQKNG